LSASRNSGITASESRYVAFLDADDLMLARSLEDRITALEAQDDIDVAGSYSGVRYDYGRTALRNLPTSYATGPESMIDLITAEGECPFPVHAPLVKRSILNDVGGFNEAMASGAEDWDLWYRILRSGYRFVPASSTSVVYRFRRDGMTASGSLEHVLAAQTLIRAANLTAHFKKQPGGPNPLNLPLAEYQVQIAVARRAVRFAAMAALQHRCEEARDIIRSINVSEWTIVARHLQLAESVLRAARRLGAERDSEEAMEAVTDWFSNLIRELVDSSELKD
jgi:GT2 family glycosyltransferase